LNGTVPSIDIPADPDRPFLLAADIDGTLLGDEEGETWLRKFARRHRRGLLLAVVTGRRSASVLGLVDDGRLPRPDFIFGEVGTDLVDCRGGEIALRERYEALVPRDWNPDAIHELGTGEGVRPQEFPDGRPRFQAGFDWDGRPETLAALRDRLAGVAGGKILPSGGTYIDVLPAAMGKGGAVRFLQRELALDPDSVVVAGDSGNDREMFETGFRGILPSNATEELRSAAGGPQHYRSPFPAARGVLDGLRHFGFVASDDEASMERLTVRCAGADDAGRLAEIGAETFADTFAADNTPGNMAAYLAEQFGPQIQARELADPQTVFLIAESGGDAAGYARLKFGAAPDSIPGKKPVEIVRFYARKAWIGKGVGSQLMLASLAEAERAGCDTVWLDVWERNPRAIAFYRKWGFRESGTQAFRLGEDVQHDLLMARPVDDIPAGIS
jgi:hydroxymethylpyrimidine pyrophosphatase-like HAD family hydrolase/GNAT superfamily N-acetyltransferase